MIRRQCERRQCVAPPFRNSGNLAAIPNGSRIPRPPRLPLMSVGGPEVVMRERSKNFAPSASLNEGDRRRLAHSATLRSAQRLGREGERAAPTQLKLASSLSLSLSSYAALIVPDPWQLPGSSATRPPTSPLFHALSRTLMPIVKREEEAPPSSVDSAERKGAPNSARETNEALTEIH